MVNAPKGMSILTEDTYKKGRTTCRKCYNEKALERSSSSWDIYNKQTSSSKLKTHRN